MMTTLSNKMSTTYWLLFFLLLSATSLTAAQNNGPPRCLCGVVKTDMLMEDTNGTRSGLDFYDCTTIDESDSKNPNRARLRLQDMPNDMLQENLLNLQLGRFILDYPCNAAINGKLPIGSKNGSIRALTKQEAKDRVPGLKGNRQQSAQETNTVSAKKKHYNGVENGIRARGLRQKREQYDQEQEEIQVTALGQGLYDKNHDRASRRRLSSVGFMECAIVIVNAPDVSNPMTAAQADDMLYRRTSDQFEACSGGAMRLVKGLDTIEITLPNNLNTYTDATGSIMNAIWTAHCNTFNGALGIDCNSEFDELAHYLDLDHILYSIPRGISGESSSSGYWAYASTGDSRRFSIYNGGTYTLSDGEQWPGGFFVPSTIMHELGHNYRLGHAYDPNKDGNADPYGDATTHMGGGSNTRKCFSGFNYYMLGWHQHQTNEVLPSANSAQVYNLKGISDLATGGVINIKVGPYYILYHLRRGINDGIDDENNFLEQDYTDEVIIHEGKELQFGQSISANYQATYLRGNLKDVGDTWSVSLNGQMLRVSLCSIDRFGSAGAMISIGYNAIDCSTPGPVTNPVGFQTLTDGVTVSSLSAGTDQVLEFIMDVPNNPDAVTCSTSGGSGDSELTMSFGNSPRYSSSLFWMTNACYDTSSGNSASCTVTNQAEGRFVYVSLLADSAFSGVSLTCNVLGGTSHPPTPAPTSSPTQAPLPLLVSGVTEIFSGSQGTKQEWMMEMLPNTESVSCSMTGGSGDADLYVRWTKRVNFARRSDNQCVPYGGGNEEECSQADLGTPRAVLYVGIDAFSTSNNVQITCTMVNGPSVAPTSVPTSSSEAPSSEPTTTPSLSPTSVPSASSESPSSEPTMTPSLSPTSAPSLSPTTTPTTSIMPSGSPTSSEAPSSSQAPTTYREITLGVPMFVSAPYDGTTELVVRLPPGSTSAYCAIGQGTGDADLVARWNYPVNFDNLYANDCVPFKHGNNEQCTPVDLGPAYEYLYLGLFAYRAFENVLVLCIAM